MVVREAIADECRWEHLRRVRVWGGLDGRVLAGGWVIAAWISEHCPEARLVLQHLGPTPKVTAWRMSYATHTVERLLDVPQPRLKPFEQARFSGGGRFLSLPGRVFDLETNAAHEHDPLQDQRGRFEHLHRGLRVHRGNEWVELPGLRLPAVLSDDGGYLAAAGEWPTEGHVAVVTLGTRPSPLRAARDTSPRARVPLVRLGKKYRRLFRYPREARPEQLQLAADLRPWIFNDRGVWRADDEQRGFERVGGWDEAENFYRRLSWSRVFPDARRWAAGFQDGTVFAGELGGEARRLVRGRGSPSWPSEHGTRFLVADGRALALHDATTGVTLEARSYHRDAVTAVRLDHDGHHVISGDWRGVIHVARVADGEVVRTFDVKRMCSGLLVSPDGRRLHAFSDAGWHVWDLVTGEPVEVRWGHTFVGIGISPDGVCALFHRMRSYSDYGHPNPYHLVDIATGKTSVDLSATGPAFAFSLDGRWLYVEQRGAGFQRVLRVSLLDGAQEPWVSIAQGSSASTTELGFSRDGRYLFGRSGRVRCWDLADGGREIARGAGFPACARNEAMLDGFGTVTGAQRLATLDGETTLARLSYAVGFYAAPVCALSADGRRLAAGTCDGQVFVFDVLGAS